MPCLSRLSFAALSTVLLAGVSVLHADPIPYSNPGQPAPLMTLTATASGPIMGYFVDSSAGDTDKIALLDLTTGVMSSYFFVNQSSKAGDTANFGTVTKGDKLVFVMDNVSTGTILRSDAKNADGDTHAYITPFSGGTLDGVSLPAGLYVGFEDLLTSQKSDLDYNDDDFVFTNMAAQTVTPEPGSLMLMGTGALSAFGVLRRKLARG